ncbi:MAG: hypothetical protein IKK19_02650, partial [Bacteroidales bacterium]|nr:hypothetical protein [Bacteroidales bacterium]
EGNLTRIIDYKTGSVTPPDSKFELPLLFDKEGDGRYKAILQLYLYALIYFNGDLQKGSRVKDALLTIYPLRRLHGSTLCNCFWSMMHWLRSKGFSHNVWRRYSIRMCRFMPILRRGIAVIVNCRPCAADKDIGVCWKFSRHLQGQERLTGLQGNI